MANKTINNKQTQSADQYISGVWIKYSSSDACADHFRQPNYSLGQWQAFLNLGG